MDITMFPYFILALFIIILLIYFIFYFYLLYKIKKNETIIIDIFLKKVSKIPALIEVMRPYVAFKESFSSIIETHTQVMVESTKSIYDILGHEKKIQNDFIFLMKLSAQIPNLQKHEYFLYIRNFIMEYGKDMKSNLINLNKYIGYWNQFIIIKDITGIGLLLPGKARSRIE